MFRSDSLGMVLLAAIVLPVVTVFAFVQLGQGANEQSASATWPTVQGEIVKSETYFPSLRSRARIRLEYTYEVDGYSYLGRRHRAHSDLEAWWSASDVVARHPVGSAVPVYYKSVSHP